MRKGVTNKKDEDNHRLVFKGNAKLYYHQKVIVNFAPVTEAKGFIHPQMRDLMQFKRILPTFNADKLYFTPGFVMPSQQRDNQVYKTKHNNKMQQYEQINAQQILIPKPKDRHYCHICEYSFEDYYEHIHQKSHISAQKNNKYQRKIKKMCKKFHRKNNLRIKYTKQSECSDLEESMSRNSEKQNNAINKCSEILV